MSCIKIFLADLSGIQYLFEILQTSLTVKNIENVVWSGCFENVCDEEGQNFSCVKMLILDKLPGGRCLFEILHASYTLKISKNVKSGCF